MEAHTIPQNDEKESFLDKLVKIIELISKQMGWMAGSLAFIMMVAIIREVFGRYFLNSPTDWSVDLNSFLLVGIVYLGSSYTTIVDGHVRADFFYSRITGRRKAWLDIFIDLICIYYCSMIVWEGWLFAYDSLIYGEVSSGGVRWPLFPFQVLVPIGSLLIILCIVTRILVNIRFLRGKGKIYKPSGAEH